MIDIGKEHIERRRNLKTGEKRRIRVDGARRARKYRLRKRIEIQKENKEQTRHQRGRPSKILAML